MESTNQSAIHVPNETIATAKSLRRLYFTRAAFSIAWVILVAAFAKDNVSIATILFIIYPVWDALATFFDIKANPPSANKIPQYVNVAISIVTTVAVIITLQIGIPEALMVFGAWATLTGLIQLIVGLRRRKLLGGQWPMMISGAQSMLAGLSFIAMANSPDLGIPSLAGYAAFGAFYFLLSAFRLGKTIKATPTLP